MVPRGVQSFACVYDICVVKSSQTNKQKMPQYKIHHDPTHNYSSYFFNNQSDIFRCLQKNKKYSLQHFSWMKKTYFFNTQAVHMKLQSKLLKTMLKSEQERLPMNKQLLLMAANVIHFAAQQ